MVKIFSTLFIFAFVIVSTSCKKEYSCTCISAYNGGSYKQVTTASSTKGDAQAWCTALQTSSAQPGVATSCSLN